MCIVFLKSLDDMTSFFNLQGHLDRHVHDYHETEEGSLRDSTFDLGDWDYDADPNPVMGGE